MIGKYTNERTVLFFLYGLTIVKIAIDIVVYLGFDVIVFSRYFNANYFYMVAIYFFTLLFLKIFRKPHCEKSGGRTTCEINSYVNCTFDEGYVRGGSNDGAGLADFRLVDDHTVNSCGVNVRQKVFVRGSDD